MKIESGLSGSLAPNPNWAKLPLFDRKCWKHLPFGVFAESVNQRVEPSDAPDDIYVGLDDLDSRNLHIRRWGKGSDVIGTKLRFRKGDIIFGRRRAYQRKLAVAEFDGICSAHAMVVRAKSELVLPEFLPFLMMSDRFMNRAIEISVGSLSPTINWKALKLEGFELPPLAQQRHLAETLWATDDAVRASTINANAMVELQRAVFRDIFRKKNAYPKVAVRESGDVQLGRQRAPKYQTGTSFRPYLRVANVFDGYIDYSDVLEMDFNERDFRTFKLEPGDILLNEGQSRELVGRCAIFNGAIEGCCFQNTLIRYRASKDLLAEYAFAFFQYCFHFGLFSTIASQTTSIAHLGSDRFGALLIPVPPKKEQIRIVDRLKTLQSNVSETKARLNTSRLLHQKIINAFTQ